MKSHCETCQTKPAKYTLAGTGAGFCARPCAQAFWTDLRRAGYNGDASPGQVELFVKRRADQMEADAKTLFQRDTQMSSVSLDLKLMSREKQSQIIPALEFQTGLVEITLENGIQMPTSVDTRRLFGLLAGHARLARVSVDQLPVRDEDLAALITDQGPAFLTELTVIGGKLTDAAADSVAIAMEREDTVLAEVDLHGNRIGNRGAVRLAGALGFAGKKRSLQNLVLSLNFNQIGDVGAIALADALVKNPETVEYLGLSENPIGESGRRALQKADDFRNKPQFPVTIYF